METLPRLKEGASLQVGKQKATIVRYISEGGFAQIYEVLVGNPKEPITACLKRVIVPDKNGLNQLRKEVEVMKTFRDGRNIVTYFDSHAERLDNGTYQVLVLMELCPGGSLLDYMNQKIKTKLTEPEILKIMLDACQGVYEMHKSKLIHRDLKIENVLINAQGTFKLCDFGSTTAPIMPPQDQQQFKLISHDTLYHTTPQYRSPEMVDLYRQVPIDEKADIWALGCFLYKLCYYTTPFEANGEMAILHASFQFPPLPQYSGDLKNLIIIMLQENPLYRPNIVQVLMLVCKISGIKFESLKLKDFYKLGPYNFQTLQEYQAQKQAEIMREKQIYLHQQSLANAQDEVVVVAAGSPEQPEAGKAVVVGEVLEPKEEQTKNLKVEEANVASPNSLLGFSSGNDESFSDLEQLEDAEERYPSLQNLAEEMAEPVKVASEKSNEEKSERRVPIIDVQKGNTGNNPFQRDTVHNPWAAEQTTDALQTNFPHAEPAARDKEAALANTSTTATSNTTAQHKPDGAPSLPMRPQISPPMAPVATVAPVNFQMNPPVSPSMAPVTNSNFSQYSRPVMPQLSSNFSLPRTLAPETNLIDLEKPVEKKQPAEVKLVETKPDYLRKPSFEPAKGGGDTSSAKPNMSKRFSSSSQLVLQEEVVDFASDDENLDNGSNMSRMKIRNSLKFPKARKSSELKRNDSYSSDSKKRHSFFGA
ncbi:uncharacterized protein LODBEIA_P38470 [Lodderomyces beijingensis]|uniref:Protein kinase domain-containing protein n=1 Tax=Lodderomyces beijingensis TaxID=1775926 RepID=A0ABP0ZNC1_9ASCO